MGTFRFVMLLSLAGVIALASVTRPRESQASGPYDFSGASAMINAEIAGGNFPGASMLIVKDGQVLHEQHFGTFGPNTIIPIASASKWISGAVMMSLVDDGVISMDDTVSEFLPTWTGQKGSITIRQLFSHTSGLPSDHSCLGDGSVTMAQCVEQIRQVNLAATPGTAFIYGGASMQVAGHVAEVASGKTWAQLFAENIGTPLGMGSTFYWPLSNPQIGGGVITTLADYGDFLRMMQARGKFGSGQVLSTASVATMEQDQTGASVMAYNPHPDGRRYGIGVWRDLVASGGQAVQVSSQGKFAMSPWLDRERRYFAIFFVQDDFLGLYSFVEDLQAEVRAAIDAYDTDDDGQGDGEDNDDDGDGQLDPADGCASMYTAWTTDLDDGDCDGFPDTATVSVRGRETSIGTDPVDRCADTTTLNDERGPQFGEPMSPWPPDVNDSRRSDISDVVAFGPAFNKIAPDSLYNPRVDLNADTRVNLSDIVVLGPFFNKLCSP